LENVSSGTTKPQEANVLKRIAMSLLALTLLSGPTQPAAACETIYLTRIYSDDTYTVQVGYISGRCAYPQIQYVLTGTFTYYQTHEAVDTCGCGPIE
jgi:hypothetical protein